MWKIQQTISRSRSWFYTQLIWWVEEHNVGHLGVFRVVFVFVFVFLSSSSFCICQLCGSLMAGGNKSHVCQGKQKCLLSKLDICTAKFDICIKLDICTAKFDICITPFVFSTLEHRTLNVQCSMFNVQCLMFGVQCSNIRCVTRVGGVWPTTGAKVLKLEMREMCTVSKMVLF
jgi:hypothetical protein